MSALPALPLTVPLTLPVKLPINVVAYAFANFAVELPKFLVLLPSGNMFAVVSTPVSCVAPPTFKFLAIPIPPKVFILPVLNASLCVSEVTFISPLVLILPVTSNASSGASLLIPIRKLLSTLKTVLVDPAFFTRKSILDPSI